MRNVTILLVSSLVFWSSSVLAAPVITGVTGAFSNNSTATISGSGFGTKSPVAPMLWTQFEDGANGANLPTVATWTAYNGSAGGKFDNTASYSGTLAAYQKYIYGSVGENTSNYIFPDETDEVYYSYMLRGVHDNGAGGAGEGHKSGRSAGTGNTYNGAGVVAMSYNNPYYDPDGSTQAPISPTGATWYSGSDGLGTKSPRWQRHELYKKNSTAGATDGAAWINISDGQANPDSNTYWDNTKGHAATGIMTRAAGQTFKQSSILLGIMYTNSGVGSSHEIWVDDVYVDNTQARIELCTGSTWTTRTHCEPQIPKTTWSDGTAIFTLNQGTLADGSDAYLYIVDASGDVSEPVQLTLGTSDASTDFTPPVTSTSVPAGRYDGKQSITLTANESATTQYCTGTTSCTPATSYTGAVTVYPGNYLCFQSTDSASNAESTKCQYYGWTVRCQ